MATQKESKVLQNAPREHSAILSTFINYHLSLRPVLEHSAILLTFIKQPFVVIKTFVLLFLVAVLDRLYCTVIISGYHQRDCV